MFLCICYPMDIIRHSQLSSISRSFDRCPDIPVQHTNIRSHYSKSIKTITVYYMCLNWKHKFMRFLFWCVCKSSVLKLNLLHLYLLNCSGELACGISVRIWISSLLMSTTFSLETFTCMTCVLNWLLSWMQRRKELAELNLNVILRGGGVQLRVMAFLHKLCPRYYTLWHYTSVCYQCLTPCHNICEVMQEWVSRPFVVDPCNSTKCLDIFLFH